VKGRQRLVILVQLLLFLGLLSPSLTSYAGEVSEARRAQYKKWAKGPIDRGKEVALACSPESSCWGHWGDSIPGAKLKALNLCKSKTRQTCRIVDVNLRSIDKLSSSSSTTRSKTETAPVTPKRPEPCNDLICGKWRINQGGYTWIVDIRRSKNPDWEFEAAWVTDGGFGYKAGDLDMRFNKIEEGYYEGQSYWRNALFALGWGSLSLSLHSQTQFLADTPCKGGNCVGTQKLGNRVGPVPKTSRPVGGSGTGFFVSSNGLIVTNHHVVDGANKILVTVPTGQQLKAQVISKSASTDLAVLKIDYETDNYLNFASPGAADIGDDVFTLGFPISDILGKEVKYSEGVINSLSGIQGDATFFQISVPIQPGNSGGPLVNQAGDVVGIVTATAAVEEFYKATGSLPQNVNWAVKAAYASLILPSSARKGKRAIDNPVKNTKFSVVFIEVK